MTTSRAVNPYERASTTARGYGTEHQRLRRYWAPTVAAGGQICRRCRQLIVPGQPWDLGHDDRDRSKYSGPEHARCNRGAPNRLRAKKRGSRDW